MRDHGLELVELAWVTGPAGTTLRVTIDWPHHDDQDTGGRVANDGGAAASDGGAAKHGRPANDGVAGVAQPVPPGVTLEDCVRVSRALSRLLDDETTPISHTYHLEVSSPGADRPLRTLADFRRNLTRTAKIKLVSPAVDGQHVLRGPLRAVFGAVLAPGEEGQSQTPGGRVEVSSSPGGAAEEEGGEVHIEVDGKLHRVELGNVREARLVIETGGASPPRRNHRAARREAGTKVKKTGIKKMSVKKRATRG